MKRVAFEIHMNDDDEKFVDKNRRFLENIDYEDSFDLDAKLSRLALLWAQENLPEPEYKALSKSHDTMINRRLIFALAFAVPLMIVMGLLFFAHPIYKVALQLEIQNMPEGATQRVIAHKSEGRNTVYWYDGDALYERPFDETGLNPDDYEDRDIVLYVDNSQNIVGVKTGFNAEDIIVIEVICYLVGMLPLPIALMLTHYVYTGRTCGKLWLTFYKDWREKRSAVNKEFIERSKKYKEYNDWMNEHYPKSER